MTYSDPTRRIFWPSFHFSLAVPPGCSITAGQEDSLFKSADERLVGWFNLHDTADRLVSKLFMPEGRQQPSTPQRDVFDDDVPA